MNKIKQSTRVDRGGKCCVMIAPDIGTIPSQPASSNNGNSANNERALTGGDASIGASRLLKSAMVAESFVCGSVGALALTCGTAPR